MCACVTGCVSVFASALVVVRMYAHLCLFLIACVRVNRVRLNVFAYALTKCACADDRSLMHLRPMVVM